MLYVISELNYEYNDNYYFGGELINKNINCFVDLELAKENKIKLEKEAMFDYFICDSSFYVENAFQLYDLVQEDLDFLHSKLGSFSENDIDSFEFLNKIRGFFASGKDKYGKNVIGKSFDELNDDEKRIIEIMVDCCSAEFYTISSVEVIDAFS